jgi:hypothetical protein
MLEWLPPFEMNVSKKKLGDFIYGTHVGFAVSKRVKEKFEQTDLKGLTNFRKVDLYYRKQLLNEEYYYPEIALIHAFVDYKYMEFEKKDYCGTCQKGKSSVNTIHGIFFTAPERIKEDVFFTTSLGQGEIIVSSNFKDFVEKEEFTNINLFDATQYKYHYLGPPLEYLIHCKIVGKLKDHKTLQEVFERENPKIIYAALDKEANKAYQTWHHQYEESVVRWLKEHEGATPAAFKEFLDGLHQDPWLQSRIPNDDLRTYRYPRSV